MSDKNIPTEKAINEYLDNLSEEIKFDPQQFFEKYLQTPKFEQLMPEIPEVKRLIKFPKFEIKRVTDVQEPRISPMTDFATSSTSTDNYSQYRCYDDYRDDMRFRSRYGYSIDSSTKIKLRGYMGPSPKKKEEKPKQTVFQFDPTGMTDKWKKPKS